MIDVIYALSHNYGDPPRVGSEKFIGFYKTRTDAENAIKRVATQPGFSRHPDGFQIFECPIDQDHWVDGFIVPRGSPAA